MDSTWWAALSSLSRLAWVDQTDGAPNAVVSTMVDDDDDCLGVVMGN